MQNSPITKEVEKASGSGYLWAAIGIALVLGGGFFIIRPTGLTAIVLTVVLIGAGSMILAGLYMLQPNEAAILLLFGEYVGTDRSEGLRWANPFYKKQKITCVRILNGERLRSTTTRQPYEIAAAIVGVAHTAGRVRRRELRRLRSRAGETSVLCLASAILRRREQMIGRPTCARAMSK